MFFPQWFLSKQVPRITILFINCNKISKTDTKYIYNIQDLYGENTIKINTISKKIADIIEERKEKLKEISNHY